MPTDDGNPPTSPVPPSALAPPTIASPPVPVTFWRTFRDLDSRSRTEVFAYLDSLRVRAVLLANTTTRTTEHDPFAVFKLSSTPACASPLKRRMWDLFLEQYPDLSCEANILGMTDHGARLGYDGSLRGTERIVRRTTPYPTRPGARSAHRWSSPSKQDGAVDAASAGQWSLPPSAR